MSSLVQAIGRRTINSVDHMLDLFAFTSRILGLLLKRRQTGRKLVLKFTSEQIYYTAIQALPIVLFIALITGSMIVIQLTRQFGEEAVSFFDESVATYSDLNDQEGVVKALSNKAATLIRTGKLDKAELVLEEAMQVLPAGSNERLLIPVLQNRGVLLTKRGSYEDAEKVLDRCLNQARSLDPMGMASLHFAYGNLMLKTGRSTDAIGSFEKALSIDRELGFHRGIADDLFSIGQAYVKLGQDEKAVRSWKRSAKVFALIDQPHELHETMNHLREAAQKAGVDISVTEAFVERWHDGELYESPCRN